MRREGFYRVLFLTVFVLLTATLVFADDPVGPDGLSTVSTSRRTISTSAQSRPAEAGNVSELKMNTTTITQGWQGYYGNITGIIVLDDASNNSMYTWDWADPYGEIFATRDTDGIDWGAGNIICANISHIVTEESNLNFNLGTGQDADGINETFNKTTHPAFNVSSNNFAANQCNFTVSTYVDDAVDASRKFNETLLYSSSDTALVYAAFIVQGGADGFKTGTTKYDFQMLVAEDGHQGDTSTTDYYFYVELG